MPSPSRHSSLPLPSPPSAFPASPASAPLPAPLPLDPRLLPSVALHAGARGGARTVVMADRKQGVLLQIDLPGQALYSAYTVDLYNSQGKLTWTRNFTPGAAGADSETLSVALPGAGIEAGAYSLAISGVSDSGQRSEVQRQNFDIQFHD